MEIKRIIEAVLFATPRPLSLEKLSEILGESKNRIKDEIELLRQEYEKNGNSFQIMEIAQGYALYTKPEFASYVKALRKDKVIKLSKPILETLAIIAYRQPLTRAEIAKIRRVDADWAIRVLLEKGLIRVTGRLSIPGKPFLYGTTDKFLEVFGLSSIDELPRIE